MEDSKLKEKPSLSLSRRFNSPPEKVWRAWKSTPARESLVTLTFRPSGSGTEFSMLHEQFFDVAARDRHAYGWTGSLAKLASML